MIAPVSEWDAAVSPSQINKLASLYNSGDLEGAVRLGGMLLRDDPNAVMVRNVLGAAEAALGRPDRAVMHFQAVAELTPQDAAAQANLGLALDGAGDAGGAIAAYRRAVALAPGHAGAHANLAAALRRTGDLAGAVESFRAAAHAAPGDAATQMNLGAALSEFGDAEAAIQAYRAGLKLDPANAQGWFNLAVVQKRAGRLEDAARSYGRAIERDPKNALYLNNLGLTLRALGRRGEAIAAYGQATEAAPDFAEAHNNLGQCLADVGRIEDAIAATERAVALRPGYPSAATNLAALRSRQVPLWHIGMMNDAARNDAFFRGIAAAVRPGDQVLEIGAGSGLLAMRAADAGAGQVVTCEMAPAIAATAARIVERNGFAGRVRVLNKKSTDLRLPEDMPRPADVIVAEILSSEFVGEGVVASLRDARLRLLAKGGRMVPAGGAIMLGLLADHPTLRHSAFVDEVAGYDLSAFNAIRAAKLDLPLGPETAAFLADPVETFRFDFMDPAPFEPRTERFRFDVRQDGAALGVVQWNRVDLGAGVVYENDPSRLASHWSTPLYLFDAPLPLKAGESVVIEGSLAEDIVWFRRVEA